jgi:hypothetical protein
MNKYSVIGGQVIEEYMSPEKGEAKFSRDMLNIYANGKRTDWIEGVLKDRDFYQGKQIPKAVEAEYAAKRQAAIVNNVIFPAVEQATAMLTTNKPAFSATGRDDSDKETAKAFAELMAYIWDISNGNAEIKLAIKDYYVTGCGWMGAYFQPNADSGNGEIFVESIDPVEVYVDPNSRDLYARDAAHIIVTSLITQEKALKMYPKFSKFIGQGEGKAVPEDNLLTGESGVEDTREHTRYRKIDRYSKFIINRFKILDTVSGWEKEFDLDQFKAFVNGFSYQRVTAQGTDYFISPERKDSIEAEIAQMGMIYHMEPQLDAQGMMQSVPVPGPMNENSIPGSEVKIEFIDNEFLLKQGIVEAQKIICPRIRRVLTIGDQIVYNEQMWEIEDYPLVPLYNRFERNPYPKGDVAIVKNTQEQLNKLEMLIVAHTANSTNVKVWYPQGSVKKEDLEQMSVAGVGAIPYNPEFGTPVVAAPIPLSSELFHSRQLKIEEIERTLGIYAMQQGDASSAPATFKGTIALEEFGQRRIRSKQDDIEGAINQLAKVVVRMAQSVYTYRKAIRLIKPNNIEKSVILNGGERHYDDVTGRLKYTLNDITVGKYDVIVVSGSMLPSSRWAQFDYYFQMFQAGLIDQEEMLKKTEIVDTEGVLERTSIINQLNGYIAQLEEKLKKIEGDLQTAERESLHDKKRVEVEKFKTDLHMAGTEAKAATQLYQANLENDRKLEKEKIKNKPSSNGTARS